MPVGRKESYFYPVLRVHNPALFGGEYNVDTIWICSWSEWISFTASIHAQTKDLQDGSKISIHVARRH